MEPAARGVLRYECVYVGTDAATPFVEAGGTEPGDR